MNDFTNQGDMLNYVLKKLGKDVMGEYISPDDWMLALNAIQIELINHYVDNYEESTEVTADTYPFVKTYGDELFPPLILDTYGKVDFPTDIVLPARTSYTKYLNAGCTSTSEYKSVTLVTQMDFDGRMDQPMYNPLLNPNENGPLAVIQNGKIRVVPNIKQMSLTGLRFPINTYFDYDVINGSIVYLPPNRLHTTADPLPIGTLSLSVEPEWPRQVWPELCNRIIAYFATNQRSAFNLQPLNAAKV